MSFSQISAVPRPERCRAANPYWTKRGCRRSASQELVGMVERSSSQVLRSSRKAPGAI